MRATHALVVLATLALLAGAHAVAPTTAEIEAIRCELFTQIDESTAAGPGQQPMLATIVRLSFHDCVGGCDGFIDTEQHGNEGLAATVTAVDDLYASHGVEMGKADFYALVGTLATLKAADNQCAVTAPMPTIPLFFGRASATTTNDVALPNPHNGIEEVTGVLATMFGFSVREAIAIMGAHTLGRAHAAASGFTGPWTTRPHTLDNDYYRELNPRWKAATTGVAGKDSFRSFWRRENGGPDNGLMLNVDIALQRLISPLASGAVTECPGNPVTNCALCPDNHRQCPFQDAVAANGDTVAEIADEFASDNAAFMLAFGSAYAKMVQNPAGAPETLTEVAYTLPANDGTCQWAVPDECCQGPPGPGPEHGGKGKGSVGKGKGKGKRAVEITPSSSTDTASRREVYQADREVQAQQSQAGGAMQRLQARKDTSKTVSARDAGCAGTISVPMLGICF